MVLNYAKLFFKGVNISWSLLLPNTVHTILGTFRL